MATELVTAIVSWLVFVMRIKVEVVAVLLTLNLKGRVAYVENSVTHR